MFKSLFRKKSATVTDIKPVTTTPDYDRFGGPAPEFDDTSYVWMDDLDLDLDDESTILVSVVAEGAPLGTFEYGSVEELGEAVADFGSAYLHYNTITLVVTKL